MASNEDVKSVRLKKIQAGIEGLDPDKVYTSIEAQNIRSAIVRWVAEHVRDTSVWLCIFSIQKVSWGSAAKMDAFTRETLQNITFADVPALVVWITALLKSMGYDYKEDVDWQSILKPYSLAQLLPAAEHLVYLLLNECDWEKSIRYADASESDREIWAYVPKFKIQPSQATFTPKDDRKFHLLKQEDVDMKPISMRRKDTCTKKLSFDSLSSNLSLSSSDGDSNDSLDTPATAIQKLYKKMSDAQDSLRHFQETIKKNRNHVSIAKKIPMLDPNTENDGSDDDIPYSPKREINHRHVTTVLQNVEIKNFAGKDSKAEDAKQWLMKFMHVARISKWEEDEVINTFIIHLVNPARNWYKQLPKDTKKNWHSLSTAFRNQYCEEKESSKRKYYRLRQMADETPLNYFYRLNAAAMKAGISYRHDSSDMKEHLVQFYDSLMDTSFADSLRLRMCDTVDELEEILREWDKSRASSSSKRGNDGSSKFQPVRAPAKKVMTFTSNAPGNTKNPGAASGTNTVCEHCKKVGHSKDKCYQLQACSFCNKTGHPYWNCLSRARKLIQAVENRSGVKTGLSDQPGGSTQSN